MNTVAGWKVGRFKVGRFAVRTCVEVQRAPIRRGVSRAWLYARMLVCVVGMIVLTSYATDTVLAAPPYKLVVSGPGLDGEVEVWLADDERSTIPTPTTSGTDSSITSTSIRRNWKRFMTAVESKYNRYDGNLSTNRRW